MKNTEILLYGPIGSDGVTAASFAAELRAAGAGPVTVRVHSPGGDARDGLAIYNLIRQHGNVTVIIDGMAASAASYAVLGAKSIEMAKDALMMIHAPNAAGSGESGDFRDLADVLDQMEKQISGIYARKTGKSAEQVGVWLNSPTWFTAEEAKSAGLVTSISDEATARPDVKMQFAYEFKSAPAAIAARFRPLPAVVEVDPVKAELNVVKAKLTEERMEAKISSQIPSTLAVSAEVRASIVRFAIANEGDGVPLIKALSAMKEEMQDLQRKLEEARACEIIQTIINNQRSRTTPGPDPELDAYMDRLKKSRRQL